MESEEDKQLARLYDYTKFHIGIYLSFAGGLAALLGSEKIGWFLSALIAENRHALIWALGFMVLAGMCGGVVATSVIECRTFADFWEKKHGPQIATVLSFPGRVWAALEHLFFWVSLIVLGLTVVFGFAKVTPNESRKADTASPLPCCFLPTAGLTACASK